MAEMAVGATCIVVGTLMIPITDHTRSEHEERNERKGNTENAKSLLHRSINRSVIRNEPGAEATE